MTKKRILQKSTFFDKKRGFRYSKCIFQFYNHNVFGNLIFEIDICLTKFSFLRNIKKVIKNPQRVYFPYMCANISFFAVADEKIQTFLKIYNYA